MKPHRPTAVENMETNEELTVVQKSQQEIKWLRQLHEQGGKPFLEAEEESLTYKTSEVEKEIKALVELPFTSREQALTSDLFIIRRN